MLLSASEISRIEIFSRWIGFGYPPSRSGKVTITRTGDRFVRQQLPEATSDELPERLLSNFLSALSRPAVSQLDATLFDLPPAVVDRHFNSCWTDDYPSLLVRIHCDTDRQIKIESEAQCAFMLPLFITDSATDAPHQTFDPALSRALADLMPNTHLGRNRLAGDELMLSIDSTEVVRPAARDQLAKESTEVDESARLSRRLLKRRSLDTLRSLLAQGADPSVADDVGQTALMHAAFPPFNQERFRLLVEAGADLEARRRDGLTGLLLACSGGMADAAAEWVRAGADISARAPDGGTPLMLGATWPDIVRTLLAARTDVNAVDNDGHSALIYAIHHQRPMSADEQLDAIRALIDAGADVNLKDRNGVSPMGHAKKLLAAALLEEEVTLAIFPGADTQEGPEWNSRKLAEAVVTFLVAAGARQ